jgi:hypothetical protein
MLHADIVRFKFFMLRINIVMAYELGFDFWQRQKIFLFSATSKPALGPPSLVQWVPWGFLPWE